jgi:hypothetical protein
VVVDARLDAVGGAIVKAELDRLERAMFESDWAEAKAANGGATPHLFHLRRSAAQRRADALEEMARRSAGGGDAPRSARPLITVLVGEGSLSRVCELSTGTVVTPGEVLPLLRDCDIERVVFGSPSRVIDVGATQRLFVGATRRAVEVRDRACSHESCDTPAEQCEVHHVVPFDDGGPTVQANGRCECSFHHRLRHRGPPPPRAG